MTELEIRFEDAPDAAYRIMNDLIEKHFQDFANAKILILVDTKKRVSMKKIVLGKMKKTNDMLRYLSLEDDIRLSGYDYIMLIDKLAWELASEEDETRLMRHELRHCDYDNEKSNPYGIQAHEIEDFHIEIRLNEDNPQWAQYLATSVESKYYEIEKAKKSKQKSLF